MESESHLGPDPGPDLPSVPSDDEELARLLRYRPPMRDEKNAPAVDQTTLDALVRDELAEKEARAAHRLILSYRTWNDAYVETLIREYHRRHSSEQ